MPVSTVVMFQDAQGKTWPTEEQARQANGYAALFKELTQDYGKDPLFNPIDVCNNIMDWANIYLEGQNK